VAAVVIPTKQSVCSLVVFDGAVSLRCLLADAKPVCYLPVAHLWVLSISMLVADVLPETRPSPRRHPLLATERCHPAPRIAPWYPLHGAHRWATPAPRRLLVEARPLTKHHRTGLGDRILAADMMGSGSPGDNDPPNAPLTDGLRSIRKPQRAL